jgi:DNA-binding beta-propeller fold protein YncE
VSSFSTDKIVRLDAKTGEFRGMFGNEDEIDCPQGIGFGPDGKLYVVSFLRRHVARYQAESGRFLGVFARGGAVDPTLGEEATALQRFFYQNRLMSKSEREAQEARGGDRLPVSQGLPLIGPEDLAFTREGDLLVSSYFTNRVLRFDGVTGRLLGALGGVNGSVAGPVGICVGAGGHIYVAAHRQDTVVSFDGATLEYQGVFAGGGVLQGPSGIAFSADQTLYVASHLNDMIARFNGTTGVHWSFGDVGTKKRRLLGKRDA